MAGKKNKTSKINRCCGNFEKCEAQRKELQDALGKDVVKRRDELGLSQMEFICASGIPQSTVSSVEKGDSNVTLDTLRRYAQAHKTSIVGILRDKVFHQKQ
jgi:predicted transcriptional regulator